jgi:hypothetical protein
VSGHDLTRARDILAVDDQRLRLNAGEHVAQILGPDVGVLRLVNPTDVSGRLELGYSVSPMALFRGDFYLSSMASSSSPT